MLGDDSDFFFFRGARYVELMVAPLLDGGCDMAATHLKHIGVLGGSSLSLRRAAATGAVLPSSLLQEDWTNELPFSKELFDATEHRGMLTDDKTKRRLIEQSEARRKQQAEAAEATEETR